LQINAEIAGGGGEEGGGHTGLQTMREIERSAAHETGVDQPGTASKGLCGRAAPQQRGCRPPPEGEGAVPRGSARSGSGGVLDLRRWRRSP
jgi:hypothetical protein